MCFTLHLFFYYHFNVLFRLIQRNTKPSIGLFSLFFNLYRKCAFILDRKKIQVYKIFFEQSYSLHLHPTKNCCESLGNDVISSKFAPTWLMETQRFPFDHFGSFHFFSTAAATWPCLPQWALLSISFFFHPTLYWSQHTLPHILRPISSELNFNLVTVYSLSHQFSFLESATKISYNLVLGIFWNDDSL